MTQAVASTSRPIPLVRRTSTRYALVFGLLGLLLGVWLTFVIFHEQDRRPSRPIVGPGIGESFEVGFEPDLDMRITVDRGERQNSRNAGGNVDTDFITLYLTYEALTEFARVDLSAWNALVDGEEVHGFLSVPTELDVGVTATGSVKFSGLPPGVPVVLIYQELGDDTPRFTMEVAT